MKKFFSFILAISMVFSLTTTAFANDIHMTTENIEFVQGPDGNPTNMTLSELDALIQARNDALLREEFEIADRMTEQLYQLGGHRSTSEEIASFSADGLISPTAATAGTFETYYTTSYVDGEAYEIRRMYYTPTKTSNLYHKGSVSKKNSVDVAARLCDALSVGVGTGLGFVPYVGTAISIMDCFSGLNDALTGTTVIEDIEADYDYGIMEYPVFLAYKSGNHWNAFAMCSYVSADIVTTIFDVYWNGHAYEPDLEVEKFEEKVFPDEHYYNNAPNLLEYYFTHSCFFVRVAQIQEFYICNGQRDIVYTVMMTAPDNTSEVD